ncbi:hypothetical protein [Rhodococcus sp. NPDC058521]|uniref:hypothetical protein n=1 Tax=Rhodococcus sp. NPDC058521 TaxID=3346536 RepID=UPI003647C5B2
MSWDDFHARRAVLYDVLDRARVDPEVVVRLSHVDGVIRHFGSPDNVLLALQQRWNNHLAAKLDQSLEDGTALVDARSALAAEQPTLRAVLDAGALSYESLRGALRSEQRMISAHATGSFPLARQRVVVA